MLSLQEIKGNRFKIYLIGVIGAIGLITPFIHIPFNGTEVSGAFGFKKMSSLLFAVGLPILSISASLLLFLASKSILQKDLSKVFRIFSYLFGFVGFFFLSWTLAPSINDFNPILYYLSMIGISIVMVFVNKGLSSYIIDFNNSNEILLLNIRKLTRHIGINIKKKYIKDEDRKDYLIDTIDVIDSLD
ncbi:hypothetical protein [Aquimarina algiphila]|uniref:Uncharacterized protein n=1 Tax=Aquimarina algiphila TaxID=2047982 RepID=A0A554VAE2_9FLAO|nr:hypothetical protein [Aquimarina algiphila]TSE03049.1 hypothetical protein FOF46_30150 [Aquimarina algiphila]